MARNHILLNPSEAALTRTNPYRAGPRRHVLEKEDVRKMVKAEVVVPATAELGSSKFFELKKERCFNLWAGYCFMNAVTERDSFPISRTDECINSLGEARVFSVINVNSKYKTAVLDNHLNS